MMFRMKGSFSSFSVDDISKAKIFYTETVGLKVEEEEMMGLRLRLPEGMMVFVYPKDNHQPATYTVLNFDVDNIDEAVDELTHKGVKFEQYGGDLSTDNKGVFRGSSKNQGSDIAWFKDPAGNFLSIIQRKN